MKPSPATVAILKLVKDSPTTWEPVPVLHGPSEEAAFLQMRAAGLIETRTEFRVVAAGERRRLLAVVNGNLTDADAQAFIETELRLRFVEWNYEAVRDIDWRRTHHGEEAVHDIEHDGGLTVSWFVQRIGPVFSGKPYARASLSRVPEEEPLSPFEKQILEALNGRAMTKDRLAHYLKADPSHLGRNIKPLMESKRVQNRRKIGYYRPDAPPPGV